jgi:DNA-binding SARP family transcriptional activator
VGFEVGVLGPLLVRGQADGETAGEVRLRPFERRVLAAIALDAPRPVTASRLESLLWPRPPATARKALQTHVARIRRATGDAVIATTSDGYRLGADVQLDRVAFEAAMAASSTPARTADLAARHQQLVRALDRWRGQPYVELDDGDDVGTAREQLREQRRVAEERLAECRLLLGEVDDAVVALERLVAEEPYRERRWWLLMLALYRAGRRRDGLAAFSRARGVLNDGVGLDPGDELVALERRLVADDPSLLAASALDGGRPPAGPERLPATALVGRDEELSALQGLVDRAQAGAGGLVVVEGTAGIGKSALGRAVAAWAAPEGVTVAWTACEEEPARPLQPFEDVVAALVRDLGVARVVALAGADAPALAALLPGARDGGVAVSVGMGPALRHLLVAAAAERPLLVVLDDAHWSPPATQRFVEQLPSAGAGIAVLVLTRPEGGSWRAHADDCIALAPLAREETGALVQAVLDAAHLDDDVVDELWRRSGGQPLLARELAAALVAQGSLRDEGEGWVLDSTAGVPDSVAELVRTRVAELGPTTAAVLQAAAVLGVTVDLALLDAIVPEAAAGVRDGVRAGLLVDPHQPAGGGEPELVFAHALTHAAVLAAVPAGRRIELHESAGLVLAERPDAPALEVARHLVAAAPLDLDRAVAAAHRAGLAASAAFAHDLAVDQHRSELDLLESAGQGRSARACDALTALGDAERLAGDDGCRKHLEEAALLADELDDGDRLAAAAWSLCQLGPTTRVGDVDADAAALATRALDVVRSPVLRARLAGAVSLLLSMGDDPQRCRALYDLAVTEADATGDDALVAHVLPYGYLALGGPDDLAERRATTVRLEQLVERLDDPIAHFEALQLRFSLGVQDAEGGLDPALAEMERLADRIADPGRRWAVGYLRSALVALRGDPDEAERLAGETLAAAEEIFEARALAAYGVQLLAVRDAQGRLPELAPLLDQVLAEQPDLAAWHAARAWVAAAEGDRARAVHELDLVLVGGELHVPRDFTWLASACSLARAAAAIGDAERSSAAARALAPYAGQYTWVGTCTLGPVDLALAEALAAAGDRGGALRHAQAAVELSSRLQAPDHRAAAEQVRDAVAG